MHDPRKFAADLGAKLATRSRHICVFIGAGAAKACGLPDVKGLEENVKEALADTQRADFERLLVGRNIEQVLSRLRRIAGLVTGTDTVDGLSKSAAEQLDRHICKAIVAALAIDVEKLDPMKQFAAWVARAGYRDPIELFTVNYDLLIETALEERAVPYFDGFVGTLRARFRTDLVETPDGLPAHFARVWKLHGSVHWERNDDQITRIGHPVSENLPAAIYPSDAKYEESRRVPFLVLQDRFRRALNHPETLVLISGFSFGDDHLNEIIFDAASRRERSEFIAFSFDAIGGDLATRAKTTPNMQVIAKNEAILGGVRDEWKGPDHDLPDLWISNELSLPDFAHLAAYLARSSAHDGTLYCDA